MRGAYLCIPAVRRDKVKKNLFIFVTAMLCLLFVPKGTSIVSHAATRDLVDGSTFNQRIKSFTNSNVTWTTEDKTIKKIIFAKEPGKPANKLSQKSVGDGVMAYYDESKDYRKQVPQGGQKCIYKASQECQDHG